MFQQNQNFKTEVGQIFFAPTEQYPKRQFKLIQLLGSGSEGYVFKATVQNWVQNKNDVALKFSTTVKEQARTFYGLIIDYQEKYENPNSSNYPPSNIIRIYDIFEISNYFVVVMELGQGDLYSYINQNKNSMTLQYKQQLCLQILSSIAFLHSQNVIHRDIKPENYLMVDLQAKLIDFGQTRLFCQDQRIMTQQVGTKLFQSPELIQGKSDYTMAVDVWAMAFVFYEIIQGVQLIDVKTPKEVEDIVKQHIVNQTFLNNKIDQLQISDEWKQLIKRMLHPDSNQRITAKEAQERLSKSNITMNSRMFINNLPQQQTLTQTQPLTQTPNKQIPFNGPIIQQQQILNNINSTIIGLQNSNNIVMLQQSKEQSIKQLSILKELTIKTLSQLEINPNLVLSTNNSDSSQENQKLNQQIIKKEIPPSIKQKLDEQRKLIQEIEEKCITSQEETDLNDNLQSITNELQSLKQITERQLNKYKDYKQIEEQYENLKQLQKNNLKKEMLIQNVNDLQTKMKNYNLGLIQREIENNQNKILEMEQQINTIKYLEHLKQKQSQIIDDLNKQIDQQKQLEIDVINQKDEIFELKIKQQCLETIQNEMDINTKKIIELKQEIDRQQQFIPQYNKLKQEVESLDQQKQELGDIEQEVKYQKEQILITKAKLRELPNEKQKQDQYKKELDKLKSDQQNFDSIQNQVDSLRKEIMELTMQKNLKLEREEEMKLMMAEKKQLEKPDYGRNSAINNYVRK